MEVLLLEINNMQLGPLGTNCYIVYNNKSALIIDPGGEANKIIAFLQQNKLTAEAILLTHAHFDHIGAVEALRTNLGLDVYLHQAEVDWLGNPHLNRSAYYPGEKIITNQAERVLIPGKLQIGSFTFEVIHTPGHSPGSVSFVFEEGFVISGDVLFQQGIGRTDLPGGDMAQLESSIRNYLYQLNDSVVVYPGHGPKTTIKDEKKNNPFFPAL